MPSLPSKLRWSPALSLDVMPKSTLYNWAAMKLLFKFNLVLILVFGTGIGVAGYISHNFLEQSAREEVLQQARLMMGAAGGMRTYTSQQLSPLLQAHPIPIDRDLNTCISRDRIAGNA